MEIKSPLQTLEQVATHKQVKVKPNLADVDILSLFEITEADWNELSIDEQRELIEQAILSSPATFLDVPEPELPKSVSDKPAITNLLRMVAWAELWNKLASNPPISGDLIQLGGEHNGSTKPETELSLVDIIILDTDNYTSNERADIESAKEKKEIWNIPKLKAKYNRTRSMWNALSNTQKSSLVYHLLKDWAAKYATRCTESMSEHIKGLLAGVHVPMIADHIAIKLHKTGEVNVELYLNDYFADKSKRSTTAPAGSGGKKTGVHKFIAANGAVREANSLTALIQLLAEQLPVIKPLLSANTGGVIKNNYPKMSAACREVLKGGVFEFPDCSRYRIGATETVRLEDAQYVLDLPNVKQNHEQLPAQPAIKQVLNGVMQPA